VEDKEKEAVCKKRRNLSNQSETRGRVLSIKFYVIKPLLMCPPTLKKIITGYKKWFKPASLKIKKDTVKIHIYASQG